MSRLRQICFRFLDLALPLLFFQVVFLAPLPDTFGLNYDLASLRTSGTAACSEIAGAPLVPDEPLVQSRMSDPIGRVSWTAPNTRQKCLHREKHFPEPEGDDEPFSFPGLRVVSHGEFSPLALHPSSETVLSSPEKNTYPPERHDLGETLSAPVGFPGCPQGTIFSPAGIPELENGEFHKLWRKLPEEHLGELSELNRIAEECP